MKRSQMRNHAYVMSDSAIPKHSIPPAPVITSTVVGGLIAWRGSAWAIRYTIERYDRRRRVGPRFATSVPPTPTIPGSIRILV